MLLVHVEEHFFLPEIVVNDDGVALNGEVSNGNGREVLAARIVSKK